MKIIDLKEWCAETHHQPQHPSFTPDPNLRFQLLERDGKYATLDKMMGLRTEFKTIRAITQIKTQMLNDLHERAVAHAWFPADSEAN